ncbi:MAG: Rdx family protein [Myxococcota bacterium]|nr:Rdx family protein [Myxococcota bacterium]
MAVGLAAEIHESLQLEATLIEGSKGIFDIRANGRLVFSKHVVERFPFLGEVIQLLKEDPFFKEGG